MCIKRLYRPTPTEWKKLLHFHRKNQSNAPILNGKMYHLYISRGNSYVARALDAMTSNLFLLSPYSCYFVANVTGYGYSAMIEVLHHRF